MKANELFKNIIEDKIHYSELYKAILAREIGIEDYDDEVDEILEEALMDGYYRNGAIISFIDADVVDYAHNLAENRGIKVNKWE